MEKIRIRIATPNDRDAIETLTTLLVIDQNEEFDPKRFEWGLLRRLYDPLQRHGLFLAESVDKSKKGLLFAVGIIFSELRVDPFGYSEGYIKQFYVRPEYRNRGIGSRLLDLALTHLQKIDVQQVKVNAKINAQDAVKMYTNRRFTPQFTVYSLKMGNKTKEITDEECIFEIEKS